MNGYDDPSRLGVDRWAAMIGAYQEFGGNTLVLDIGTAVTIDYINTEGSHEGGKILPGLRSSLSILDQSTCNIKQKFDTSDISSTDLNKWGRNTKDAVISGALAAITGAINGAISSFSIEDLKPSIVLTGGDANYFKGSFSDSSYHRPNLVLYGIANILDENN
jgi:type III pantothenate kinase